MGSLSVHNVVCSILCARLISSNEEIDCASSSHFWLLVKIVYIQQILLDSDSFFKTVMCDEKMFPVGLSMSVYLELTLWPCF